MRVILERLCVYKNTFRAKDRDYCSESIYCRYFFLFRLTFLTGGQKREKHCMYIHIRIRIYIFRICQYVSLSARVSSLYTLYIYTLRLSPAVFCSRGIKLNLAIVMLKRVLRHCGTLCVSALSTRVVQCCTLYIHTVHCFDYVQTL